MTPDELCERLLEFAVGIAKLVDRLPKTKTGNHVAGQLIRSGTSAGPNYEEACGAESRNDFAHKIAICLKELRESRFWLRFIAKACLLPAPEVQPLLSECQELCNIMGKSLVTARRNAVSSVAREDPGDYNPYPDSTSV